jgi:hypothetical protein
MPAQPDLPVATKMPIQPGLPAIPSSRRRKPLSADLDRSPPPLPDPPRRTVSDAGLSAASSRGELI